MVENVLKDSTVEASSHVCVLFFVVQLWSGKFENFRSGADYEPDMAIYRPTLRHFELHSMEFRVQAWRPRRQADILWLWMLKQTIETNGG